MLLLNIEKWKAKNNEENNVQTAYWKRIEQKVGAWENFVKWAASLEYFYMTLKILLNISPVFSRL